MTTENLLDPPETLSDLDVHDQLFVDGDQVSCGEVTLARLSEDGPFGRVVARLVFLDEPRSLSAANTEKLLWKIARIYARTLRERAVRDALGL